jgi:hypothetical protein
MCRISDCCFVPRATLEEVIRLTVVGATSEEFESAFPGEKWLDARRCVAFLLKKKLLPDHLLESAAIFTMCDECDDELWLESRIRIYVERHCETLMTAHR